MESARIPDNELERLQALHDLRVLDTPPEETFDRIARVVATALDAPISLVSLVDENREWFKACFGTDEREGDRGIAFCAHTILEDHALVIEDTLEDRRFADNPQVTEQGIRFYAGIPLRTTSGHSVGVLCIKDRRPRKLDEAALAILEDLAAVAARELEMRIAAESLEKMNRALNEKTRELDEFTYVAAHDLQEPLRKLVSFCELLELDAGEDLSEAAREDLGFIMQASSRMQSLVQDLLALSRANKTSDRPRRVSLDGCLNEALECLSMRMEETGATIERGTLPEIVGHRRGLTQLFQNLVGNALKFVDDSRPPVIHVTAERVNDRWLVGVRDNGIGIKPEYAEQIFVPFKRLHNRDEFEGNGIGLSICRKTVERHGGTIWVEPTEGPGSWFRFSLDANLVPAVDPPRAAAGTATT